MTAEWLLFRLALGDLLRPKRLLMAIPLALSPSLLALIWRAAQRRQWEPEVVYNSLAGLVVIYILVLLSAIFATGVVAAETEGRTITYLLTRPLPRWRILMAKFLGAMTGIVVTVAFSLLALAVSVWGPAGLSNGSVWRDMAVYPLGAAAYGALFLLAATLMGRPLVFSLFYAFGWESWVPLLPGFFQRLSLQNYVRVLAPHPNPIDDDRAGDFLAFLNPNDITSAESWIWLTIVTVAGMVLAALSFSRRQYVPKDDSD